MAHTPNQVKQAQRMTAKPVFREEIYDFLWVVRPSDSFEKRVSAETSWSFCIGA